MPRGARRNQTPEPRRSTSKYLLRYMKISSHDLVELLSSESTAPSFPALLTILLSVGVLVIGFLQASESSDDDDSGPGDGGIMQPVGMGA